MVQCNNRSRKMSLILPEDLLMYMRVVASRKFDGNVSLLIREAINFYIRSVCDEEDE